MKWIYSYMDKNKGEVEVGLFESKESCEAMRSRYEAFGGITIGPTRVSDGYRLNMRGLLNSK